MAIGTVNDKFTEQGEPKKYIGNTIVCFFEEEESIFQEALQTQNKLKQSLMSDYLVFLPTDSFHMTVISLAREIDRGTEYWSEYSDENLAFTDLDQKLAEIVAEIPFPEDIEMAIDHVSFTKINLVPANEESKRKLLSYRDTIAERTGIRHLGHDDYHFHISLTYLLHEIPEEMKENADQILAQITQELKQNIKTFTVSDAKFVIFNDMMDYTVDLTKRVE
ncbi:DUF1868 domain-containing protein [Aerococcaceae bacterium DSM 111176]|nr:DUF1868 domain-containing protein [Aerococcaceae bacterium DSM 111176]